ncbi:MAG: DUF1800 domain-containing protein [Rhodothermales bacterium]|nr:DUF1800 domain-containing protein [Rhodothermales bacterium]
MSLPDPDKNAALQALQIEAGLEAYDSALTVREARHLLRRTSFGADPTVVPSFVGRVGSEVANEIVDEAVGFSLPVNPAWANTNAPGYNASDEEWQQYTDNTFLWLDEYRRDWVTLMLERGLIEKMTVFWHNHFVTNQEMYFHAQVAHRYISVLRSHALGNFKQLVYLIGLEGAMLIYLNGVDNAAGSPNENYGRELLELFTMGILNGDGEKNYSEDDIQQIARCLTGWQFDWVGLHPYFDNGRFDSGSKTVFGVEGTYDYDQLIDLIFEQRGQEIAQYICRKLYREFVYEAPDETIVDSLASTMIANDFEIEPVLRELLASAHFFDPLVIGAKLKSPLEMKVGFFKEVVAPLEPDLVQIIPWASWELEQILLNIQSVAGWPRHRNWIDTRTIPSRWGVIDWMVWVGEEEDRYSLDPFMNAITDPTDSQIAFKFATAVVEALFAPEISDLDIEVITTPFSGDLNSNPIPSEIANGPEYRINLAKMFLSGIPWYEWSPYNTELDWVKRLFLAQITRLPEFQMT